MIPDHVFIGVSLFLAQRLTKAYSSTPLRCHFTWRNVAPKLVAIPGLSDPLGCDIAESARVNPWGIDE